MTSSLIDFSAQFGGRDAAKAVLPYFKSLKSASRELCIEGFPFQKLAFILRVDGEVNQYGHSGAGKIELGANREYLSMDIGIKLEDRDKVTKVVCSAILSSIEKIKTMANAKDWNFNWDSLEKCLSDLITRYRKELSIQGI